MISTGWRRCTSLAKPVSPLMSSNGTHNSSWWYVYKYTFEERIKSNTTHNIITSNFFNIFAHHSTLPLLFLSSKLHTNNARESRMVAIWYNDCRAIRLLSAEIPSEDGVILVMGLRCMESLLESYGRSSRSSL